MKLSSIYKTLKFSISTLPKRIIFQKTIYLLQECGLEKKYDFVWYNFGPYSQQLADEGFNLTVQELNDAPFFTDESLEKFNELIKGHKNDSLFYEMLADIIFLIKEKDFPIEDENKLFLEIIDHRNHLNDKALFIEAFNKARKLIKYN